MDSSTCRLGFFTYLCITKIRRVKFINTLIIMTLTNQLSPRVEIVGSFLPPEELEQAIEQKCQGNLSIDELHTIEDRVIDRLIDREIEAGLSIVTDGEMRRKAWDRDFWEGLDGMSRERIDTGRIYQDDPVHHDLLRFSGRIKYNPEHPFFEKFSHMQELDRKSVV